MTLKDFPLYGDCVIVQPDGDGGDSPQRTFGMYHVGKIVLNENTSDDFWAFMKALVMLSPAPGQLIRSTNLWNDPRDIPADQFDPTVICMGLYGEDDWVREFLWHHLLRVGFYPNKNPPNLSSVASLLRALEWKWLWPLIALFDVAGVVGAIIDCARAKIHQGKDGNWLDMDNAAVKMAQAEKLQSTPLSWLTRKIYVWFYPKVMGGAYLGPNGVVLFANHPPFLQALIWKCRAPKNNPKFGELWTPIVNRWYGIK